jgi:hypothetical protein
MVRIALQAAGVLTETGEVCGAEVDRPDARLLALLARHDLAWTTYIAIQRKRWTLLPRSVHRAVVGAIGSGGLNKLSFDDFLAGS